MSEYGYVRVSSTDQNEERQMAAMAKREIPRKMSSGISSRVRILNGRNTKGC